jgi:hypothetical protein
MVPIGLDSLIGGKVSCLLRREFDERIAGQVGASPVEASPPKDEYDSNLTRHAAQHRAEHP